MRPPREQLHLVTAHALQQAWYQVRESESQMFYGLSHAEAEAEDLEDLLTRIVKILTRAFHARAGRLVLLDSPPPRHLAREYYSEKPLPGWEGHAAYWSFPVRRMALLQFGFDKPYPWLPRERTMLQAVAERCAAAIERARLNAELARLEAETRRAEEEERRRIGRELHDDTAQSLVLLRLQLEMMQRDAPPELAPPAGAVAGHRRTRHRRPAAYHCRAEPGLIGTAWFGKRAAAVGGTVRETPYGGGGGASLRRSGKSWRPAHRRWFTG